MRRRDNGMWSQQSPQAFQVFPLAPHTETDVFLAGKLTAMVAPGGGETQMEGTAEGLCGLGIRARMWRPWEEPLGKVRCLHLFGSAAEHLPLVEAARRAGLPVVLSTIAWFDWRAYWRQPGGLLERAKSVTGYFARSAFPQLPSWRRRLYQAADLLLPNSNAEAAQLMRYFQVPVEKIHVVPNGADPRFAEADPQPFLRLLAQQAAGASTKAAGSAPGAGRFVLYVGRIEPRKNQLGLIRAMQGTGVPIVLVGDAVPGHERYWRACCDEADGTVSFFPRIDHDDPLLGSAYAACGCLALTGWYETPGLAAIEAAMTGTPLVLPREGSADEYFGSDAVYVACDDLPGIRCAVLQALQRPRDPAIARRIRDHFTWTAAAQATLEAYRRVW